MNVSAFKRLTYSESRQYLGAWRERQNLQTIYLLGVKRQNLQTSTVGVHQTSLSEASHRAFKDEFRRNPRLHSWCGGFGSQTQDLP